MTFKGEHSHQFTSDLPGEARENGLPTGSGQPKRDLNVPPQKRKVTRSTTVRVRRRGWASPRRLAAAQTEHTRVGVPGFPDKRPSPISLIGEFFLLANISMFSPFIFFFFPFRENFTARKVSLPRTFYNGKTFGCMICIFFFLVNAPSVHRARAGGWGSIQEANE